MLGDSISADNGGACEQHFAGLHRTGSLHGGRENRQRLLGAEQAFLRDMLRYHLGIFGGCVEPFAVDLRLL